MQLRNKLIATVIAAAFAAPVFAADGADVKVTASVINNCKIQSTKDINFGTLDPAAATDAKADGQVTFACTKDVAYKLSADNGQNFDASSSKRQMKGSEQNFLPYALDKSDFTGAGQGFSTPISVKLEAKLAGADYRDLKADSYADVLRLTLLP